MKKLRAITLEPKIIDPIIGKRKTFAETLNTWFDKAYEYKWEIKHIINHSPKESITIIYEYEEKF